MSGTLDAFATALAAGLIRVVDLSQTLAPEFPSLVLPPELGQCAPFRMEEVSRYDERGPAWYWNTITMSEHCGTHFDAPIHWVTGRDLPDNSVDTVPPGRFVARACVIDCSKEAAADPDYTLDVPRIEAFEAVHGTIPAGWWVLMRTDWSKRDAAGYANLRDDGAHTPARRRPRCGSSWRSAAFWASAPRPSEPTPDRHITSFRPIPRTITCMGRADTGCNACAISISCPLVERSWSPRR